MYTIHSETQLLWFYFNFKLQLTEEFLYFYFVVSLTNQSA